MLSEASGCDPCLLLESCLFAALVKLFCVLSLAVPSTGLLTLAFPTILPVTFVLNVVFHKSVCVPEAWL